MVDNKCAETSEDVCHKLRAANIHDPKKIVYIEHGNEMSAVMPLSLTF